MVEPIDRDGEGGRSPSPDSDGSSEGLGEDDLDIETLVLVWKDDLLLDAIGRVSTAHAATSVPPVEGEAPCPGSWRPGRTLDEGGR